jgi:hypothetical protein
MLMSTVPMATIIVTTGQNVSVGTMIYLLVTIVLFCSSVAIKSDNALPWLLYPTEEYKMACICKLIANSYVSNGTCIMDMYFWIGSERIHSLHLLSHLMHMLQL